ncbi:gluconate kinase [Insulibacter thermoxylanivorax]|uniref:Gluconate kinase n=1 Tax=Insulibacter thermoxylanivorax TaxID=2749268 RepID=A0A916QFS7_9BACL|nr:FGGY family carbohydrate kinase [Insulibacter thermoxylanivorax]GFR38253.1 gluconate kinase [Insulibacter thermoxylanivorax]
MSHNTNVVIGIDLGTTGAKCVIWSTDTKEIAAEASKTYPLLKPNPGWAEQDPQELFEAFMYCLRTAIEEGGIDPKRIIGVGISTAMHTLLAVDEQGKPLTNCITWADGRSSDQADRIKQAFDGLAIYRRTGTPIHPMSPLAKLLWMKDERPDLYAQAAKFVSIKEYILYHLYGEWVVDVSIASATGLFNLTTMDWDEEVLRLLELDAERLSKPVPVTYALRGLREEFVQQLGIDRDTPMVIGSSDGVLANLGVGAVLPGDIAVTVGTSGAIRTMMDQPLTDAAGRTFCYALAEDRFAIGGATNNAGIVLQWLIEEMMRGDLTMEEVLREAGEAAPGADGLLFLPYLNGERAPYWNANARATFFGLSIRHQRKHMFRAALEGIVFSLYGVKNVLAERPSDAPIHASGGLARSELWLQILADVFGRRVVVPRSVEASCLGAALVVLKSAGRIEQWEEAKSWAEAAYSYEPNMGNHARYAKLFDIYQQVADKLQPDFERITEFQVSHSND